MGFFLFLSSNNVPTPFGSARLSEGDCQDMERQGSADLPSASGTVSASADVHVCHLFHNNSSDKNFTLRLAESVTLEAPPTDNELAPLSTPSGRAAGGSERGPDNTAPRHASEGGEEEEEEQKQKLGLEPACSIKRKTAKHQAVVQLDNVEEEEVREAEGDEEEEEDALNRGGVHSAPLLPTSPRSGSGSSSTELTCDCDSPDDLSDTSVSSGRSNRVKVHHAPSLTYGILSLFRAGKGGPPTRKIQGRHKRHSRSLTDVNGLEMEMELTQPSCVYDPGTDAWACAL